MGDLGSEDPHEPRLDKSDGGEFLRAPAWLQRHCLVSKKMRTDSEEAICRDAIRIRQSLSP